MRKPRLRLILAVSGLISVLVLVIACEGFLRKRDPWTVRIATGTAQGTYATLGEEFARILDELPGSPIKATPIESPGSVQNIEWLAERVVELGFVMKPALSNASPDQLTKLSAVTRLYMDVVQIVVRKDAGIGSLIELDAKKVYVGKHGSGTKIVAEKILNVLEVELAMQITEASYAEASRMLVSGELEAAFFVAGTPTDAVQLALESGQCALLDLSDVRKRIIEHVADLDTSEIPINCYPNQSEMVLTVSSDTFLLCRKDFDADQAFIIVQAFFDNLDRLMRAHNKAQDIKLSGAFVGLPEGIKLHKGVDRFRRKEEEKMQILTGALGGKYYVLGKTIKSLLEPYGIDTRVIHTDGSRENLQVLNARSGGQTPTLAILQYDVVLAAQGDPKVVYRVNLPEDVRIDTVKDMRRIATLHQETVHIMVRRDRLASAGGSQPTLEALEDLRVCLGPECGGTRILAHAILDHHGVDLKSQIFLSAHKMVKRIHSREIDAGFFVSYMPSMAVKTILDNPEIKLLSVVPKKVVNLVGPALELTEIPQHLYGCQLEGEPAIRTIATRAVLVARENQPKIRKITQAVFEGEAFLDIEGGVETMRTELPSLRLHPAARKYYRKAGYLPSKPPINWLFQLIWYFLTSTVIIVGAAKSLVELRRHRTRNSVGREILDIAITPEAGADKLATLLTLREEILERVQLRWWYKGELNKARWQYLEELIESRVGQVREVIFNAYLAEIHVVKDDLALNRETRLECYKEIRDRIWECYEKEGLDKDGYAFLAGILENLRKENRSR